jgi:hypothetical protein
VRCAVLDAWLTTSASPNFDAAADLNGDGVVDNVDLQRVLDHWADMCS